MDFVKNNNLVVLRSPTNINLDLTSKCNWKCSFCSIHNEFNKRRSSDGFQSSKKIKKIIDKINSAGVFEVTLFGGEPSLHPELVEITKYAYQTGLNIGFVSNGSRLDKNRIEEISRYLDSASLSIHGFEDTHEKITSVKGSYKTSMNCLSDLLDYGVKTGICYTGIKENLDQIEDFGNYILKNYNIYFFGVNRFVPQGRGLEKRKELEPSLSEFNDILKKLDNLKKENPGRKVKLNDSFPLCLVQDKNLKNIVDFCTAGITFGNVNEYGDLKFCSGSNYSIGNILEEDLENLWQNSPILKRYRNLDWLNEKCKNCNEFGYCLAGCKATKPNLTYCTDILVEENFGDSK